MLFQSIEYIVFLIVVVLLYWTVCSRSKNLQNGLIVVSSLLFYGWCEWRFLGLLIITALSTFFSGLWISDAGNQRLRKVALAGVLLLNLGILFYFKYFNFFIETVKDVLSFFFGGHINISTLRIILPVGISFYTFSALSYVIDIYQGKVEPTKDTLAYLAYVLFFPSILSGPISRAREQLPQYFVVRKFAYEKAVGACQSILLGGVMKLCLADRLGIYVDAVYANIAQHNGTTLLFTSILYTIQIYADFAGYSLIAIGSGRLLGMDLQVNFLRPYFAKTITEFWHRWHISLTTWFRDYIYFPLGGNRCSKFRWMFNTMAVFVISGLWHGAAYTFVIWGGIHGICMLIERRVYGDKIKYISDKFTAANILRWVITFTVVNFAWVFFRINDLSDIMLFFNKALTDHGRIFIDADNLLYAFVFMVVICIIDFVCEYGKIKWWRGGSNIYFYRYISCIAMATMILLFGVLDKGSFIYFQF